jgi:hypothetical protein
MRFRPLLIVLAVATANTYKEGVFLGYRWFDAQKREPLFPFGFGLSYTRFALSDLKAARSSSGEVELTAQVRNAGLRAGAEVVQVYAAPPACALPRPPRGTEGIYQGVFGAGRVQDGIAEDQAAKIWQPGLPETNSGRSTRANMSLKPGKAPATSRCGRH